MNSSIDASNIKAVFFDIDGTLTDPVTHLLPESAKLALDKLRKKGIKVIISTGRAKAELNDGKILADEVFDGYIYLNGQLITYHDEIVSQMLFSAKQLQVLRDYITKNNICTIFFTEDDFFCNFVSDDLINQQKKIGTSIPRVEDLSNLENLQILQIVPLITVCQEQELCPLMGDVIVSRWGENIVDMNIAGASKGYGVKTICNLLNIDIKDTISFGDADNDIAMLKETGIAVAMKNGSEHVKKYADYIADNYYDDGVYKALIDLKIIDY